MWLFGHNSRPPVGIESYRFDFNEGSSPDSIRGLLPLSFTGINGSICDKNGNLLYYSNGCHIASTDHGILPNGSGINSGIFVQEFLGDTCRDYRSIQDLLFLDDPAISGNYYICLLYTSPSPRDQRGSRMPSSA